MNCASTTIPPVILCGGSDTRLWPLSHKSFPKQCPSMPGNNNNQLQFALKRVAFINKKDQLLLLLSPIFLVLAYKVSKDGSKPFLGHVRVGQNGKPFKCYKFRSMVVNAQEVLSICWLPTPSRKPNGTRTSNSKMTLASASWVTFLRRTSLDELPQLFNVLKGDMSLVSPHPVVQAELERYGEDVDYNLMAKPGMMGLWQVSGRNDVDYSKRVYLDSWCVKNWSLWSDIAILFKTISVVTKRHGAY